MAMMFEYTTTGGDSYQLSQPEWLWLIPVMITIIVVIKLIKNKYIFDTLPASISKASSRQLLLHPLINKFTNIKNKNNNKNSSTALLLIIFLLFTLALAQPVRIGKKLPDPPQQRDITFIVDTSVSMILRDYILDGERIDRMSLLKGVLSNFIKKLKGQRMSIVVFGDNAYTLVPLTNDQQLLQKMLSRVQATMAGRFNAMGDAIALAVKQSKQANLNNQKNLKRKRILVLLTDADQPTGEIDPLVAAQLAKKSNLPLYTIAIGATSLAAEEKRRGGLLYSPVDLELVQQLSSSTGAKSYHAGSSNALDHAIDEISTHKTYKQDVKPQYISEALYHWLLTGAFIIFTFSQLFNTAKLLPGSYQKNKSTVNK